MPRICSRCRYWDRTHVLSEVGRCHRYPPEPAEMELTPGATPHLVVLHDWPFTIASDCCGEFMSQVLPFVYPTPLSAN